MKTAKTQTKTRLSKPARIAVIATAILLLAAIVFGIVWTNLDHSFRYDRIDLAPFFPDGKIPDFEEITSLSLEIETTKSPTDIDNQIATNVKTLLGETGNTYLKYKSDITKSTSKGFRDTVYLYYSIGLVSEEDEGKITPLISNLKYEDEGAAAVVMLGTKSVNELLEEFLVQYPELGRGTGDDYVPGTEVIRIVDEIDISGDEYYDYTRVLDVEITYKADPNDEASKSYLTLTGFHYQPNEMVDTNRYYRGETVILVEDPAENETAKVDSSVKKIDAALIEKITAAAKSLTVIGSSATNEGATEDSEKLFRIDTTSATYEVTYKVTLKSAFLAEQYEATIDLDEDPNLAGMTFSYKDASDQTKTIDSGKLAIAVTVEKIAAPTRELVEALVDGNTAFVAPTEEVITASGEDSAYADAYIKFIRADEIRKAEEEIKGKAETYIETLRVEHWTALVERYCDLMVIPEGFEEYDRFYEDTLAYYAATYNSGSVSTTTYPSLEEYILLSVYAEELDDDEKADVKKMTEESQKKKIEELVGGDVREAIFEKVLIFALGQHYGLEVTGGEIRDYKNELYDQSFAYYENYFGQLYSTSMSTGEIKVMAKDYAKEQISAYTKTFYRENVMLREVKESIIPDASAYEGKVTFVLKGSTES